MGHFELLQYPKEPKGHLRNLPNVIVPVSNRKSRNAMETVTDRLNLVDVVLVDDGVKFRVELVEQVNYLKRFRLQAETKAPATHLERRALAGQRREGHDVREEDGGRLEEFRLRSHAQLQLVRNGSKRSVWITMIQGGRKDKLELDLEQHKHVAGGGGPAGPNPVLTLYENFDRSR